MGQEQGKVSSERMPFVSGHTLDSPITLAYGSTVPAGGMGSGPRARLAGTKQLDLGLGVPHNPLSPEESPWAFGHCFLARDCERL